ncbi:hypothetical protein GCM10009692_09250 [Leucobacter aridicollis]
MRAGVLNRLTRPQVYLPGAAGPREGGMYGILHGALDSVSEAIGNRQWLDQSGSFGPSQPNGC